MFIRLFRYNILKMIREKEIMFWTLAFPLVLGTLFHITFGGFMEKVEAFKAIPVAYVEENESDPYFNDLVTAISEGDEALLSVVKTDKSEAEKLLKKGEVSGIYYNGKEISAVFKGNGTSESILERVANEYVRKQSIITKIAQKSPQNLETALAAMESEVNMIQEKSLTSGSMDSMMIYFYSLIAMSCLYGSFMGVTCAGQFKANLSALGARRVVASTNRFVILMADVLSSILLQIICTMLAVFYLRFVLRINMGDQFLYILYVVVFGCIIGVMTGLFIGSIGRMKVDVKMGINIAVTMAECFLSGLMITEVYMVIEKNIPILNRINPAAVITNSLYSLNVYDNYDRFWLNMMLLLIMSLILGIGSYTAIRRERYADI